MLSTRITKLITRNLSAISASRRDEILSRILDERFFYKQSNKIYRGGISGFIDYGPLGVRMKKNILNEWEQHFVQEDELYELESSIVTSDLVFQASGHVDKFEELLFSTKVGRERNINAFLRPETAQGVFVNFKNFAYLNKHKLPFGVAQVGKSFRNETSPRGLLVRMREFTQAEIEYFVNPYDKGHKKFDSVKNTLINIVSRLDQNNDDNIDYHQITIKNALEKGIISNETMAYYIARIHLFMVKIGIDLDKMRFRQHCLDEMSHYAADCWDCECLTNYGWLECVGCSDRSAFDLTRHSSHSEIRMTVNHKDTHELVPHIIEPSFGIDRLMYTILDHNFAIREHQPSRTYFKFKPAISPIQCSVIPIVNNDMLIMKAESISKRLKELRIRLPWIESKGSVGRRYSLNDQIGIPFTVVIDTNSLMENCVCVRERDSQESLKVEESKAVDIIEDLAKSKTNWMELKKKWSLSGYSTSE